MLESLPLPHTDLHHLRRRCVLLEIPETPPAIDKAASVPYLTVESVLGRRVTAHGAKYYVVAWIEPPTGDPELDHLLRKYDEKAARDLARRERLSTLRPRKRSQAHDTQDSMRHQKRLQTRVSDEEYQSSTYPSRQVEPDILPGPDLDPTDLEPI